jgi:nicotinate phosphoribosyltransferase
MSLFNHQRLTNETFKIDIQRMRQAWYTDKYFANIAEMLAVLARCNCTYEPSGGQNRLSKELNLLKIAPGDIEVEMQWFTRRAGKTLVVGVDKSLTMLKLCTGYMDGDQFVDTAKNLEVWAVEDGSIVEADGNPANVQPVMRVRGRYRDFAILETPTLGVMTRSSRVATNVYDTLVAARGKPVMFFPARFDVHEVQASDGYAYNIAVQRFNMDHASSLGPFISTDAQGDWWGGAGGGTIAHSAIACFMGDTAAAMLAFSEVLPVSIPRIALVDFNNDCVTDSVATITAMFERYHELIDAGQVEEAARYKLYGVRTDTSAALRDQSVLPVGDPALDLGVNPRLVFQMRQALDSAWQTWNLPDKWVDRAVEFCHAVKIVVSGGFTPEKIRRFETLNVPVDTYAVGSSLFDNHGPTVSDFTADVVRVKLDGQWVDMAKIGRRPCENSDLQRVW